VESTNLQTCFSQYEIGHYRDPEGYVRSWYDEDNLWEDLFHIGRDYFVTVPEKDGDLYLAAETYYYGVTPIICHLFDEQPAQLKL
jgi:hypothetical protein